MLRNGKRNCVHLASMAWSALVRFKQRLVGFVPPSSGGSVHPAAHTASHRSTSYCCEIIPAPKAWQDQCLDEVVAKVDIRCASESDQSIWCSDALSPTSMDLRGLLYFNLAFRQQSGACSMSMGVDITLGDSSGKEPMVATTPARRRADAGEFGDQGVST